MTLVQLQPKINHFLNFYQGFSSWYFLDYLRLIAVVSSFGCRDANVLTTDKMYA